MGVCVLYRPVQMFPPACLMNKYISVGIQFLFSLFCVCVCGGGLILCSLAKFMVFGDVCHKSEEIESGVLAGLRDLVENKSTELRWMHDYISLLVFTVL